MFQNRFFMLMILILFSVSVRASQGQLIKRHVLGVWSSRYSGDLIDEAFHRRAEFVLNHLGVVIDYVDLDKDLLPDPDKPEFKSRYMGVVTYFEKKDEVLQDQKKWVLFLSRLSESGIPYVMLGYPALDFYDKAVLAKETFIKFGIQIVDQPESLIGLKYGIKKDSLLGFEKKLHDYIEESPPFVSQDEKTERLLTIKAPLGKESDAVFIGSKISVAFGEFSLANGKQGSEKRMWVIDPFKFFSRALRIRADLPVPDVNVMNGNRVYYSHIDGDGFNSQSILDTTRYSGEIIFTEILKKYPMLPAGVSFIKADIDPLEKGNKRLHELARQIAALSNVELGSHTYFHPLHWGVIEKVDFSYKPPGWKQDVSIDYNREIIESAAYVGKLSNSKKTLNMQWSGDCVPGAEALKKSNEAGLFNINGGDSLFDKENSSISFLAPLGRFWGTGFQTYSSNANDNIYTKGWKSSYFSFRKVIETFERTGHEKILKPVNVYYHFFSGERDVSLASLVEIFDWISKQALSMVFPSTFIRSVLGYRSAVITALDENTFEIRDAKGLKTLRIDEPKGRVPRIKESKNIVGYKLMNGSLYVFMGEDSVSTLSLGKKPDQMGVESIRGELKQVTLSPYKISFEVSPYTSGPLVLSGISAANRALLTKINTAAESVATFSSQVRVNEGKATFDLIPSERSRQFEVTLK